MFYMHATKHAKSPACAVCCNRIRQGLYFHVTGRRANLSSGGLTASPLSSAPPNYAVKVSVYAPNMPGNFTASRNKLSVPPSVLQKCCLSLGLREFQAFCLFHCLFRGYSPVVGNQGMLLCNLIWDLLVIFLLIFEGNIWVKENYCLFQIAL